MDRRRPRGGDRERRGLKAADAVWIDSDTALGEVIEAVRAEHLLALDTEFHREKTYWPHLALVQIAWSDGLALIDPKAVDPAGIAELWDDDTTVVMHASDQDMEVLRHACGAEPTHVFDTQVAAAFVGLSTVSLGDLVRRITGVTLPKASRLTDWMARPLSEEQRRYAAADVEHLLKVRHELVTALEPVGRLEWALEECAHVRQRRGSPTDPDEVWRKIKEARSLRGQTAAVAREVAAWRERLAADRDQPVRHVMSDLAVVAIAQAKPTDRRALEKVRGVDGRHTKGDTCDALLAAVAAGASAEPPTRQRRDNDLEGRLRPAAALVAAWLAQVGRDVKIDPQVLGTRAEIQALLAGDPGSRLASGWRNDIAGEPIRGLVAGEVAVAFEPDGQLVLERRSGQVIEVALDPPVASWI